MKASRASTMTIALGLLAATTAGPVTAADTSVPMVPAIEAGASTMQAGRVMGRQLPLPVGWARQLESWRDPWTRLDELLQDELEPHCRPDVPEPATSGMAHQEPGKAARPQVHADAVGLQRFGWALPVYGH